MSRAASSGRFLRSALRLYVGGGLGCQPTRHLSDPIKHASQPLRRGVSLFSTASPRAPSSSFARSGRIAHGTRRSTSFTQAAPGRGAAGGSNSSGGGSGGGVGASGGGGGGQLASSSVLSRLRAHLVPLGLWTVVSLNVGAYFSHGDEGVQVLLNLDEFTAPLLAADGVGRKHLTDVLDRVARGTALNETLRLRLLSIPGLPERLLELLASNAPNVSMTARNHAAKVLENISASPEAQVRIVADGLHLRIIELLRAPGTSLYVKKTLASVVCNLAAQPDNVSTLGLAGALSALHDEQALAKALRRQRVAVTLGRLGAALQRLPEEQLLQLPERERQLITEYAAAEAEASTHFLHSVRSSLVESGVLLYLHTAAGGAAWGLFESLRLKESRPALVQNVVRTCLVTCFVPILFVGGLVSAYGYLNRTTDTVQEKFQLYFGSCMALYPAGRLLQWVERFAPLWLGGHIVGFFSFFVWTLYTESDLLKTDRDLLVASRLKNRIASSASPRSSEPQAS